MKGVQCHELFRGIALKNHALFHRSWKTLSSNPAVLRKHPLLEKTSEDDLEVKSGVSSLRMV